LENNIELKDIVARSIFGSIGTILNEEHLSLFIAVARYNAEFLNAFPRVVYCLNGNSELIEASQSYLREFIVTDLSIVTTENLGHTFGTFLNDRAVFVFADNFDYDYIWKFSNDVIVNKDIFNKQITLNKDFYYINNIGYNVFNTYDKDQLSKVLMDQSFYYPQTNYYIIKNHTKFYPNEELIYQLKKEYEEIKKENPSIQPWHAINGCDCEHMLAKTVEQNNLSKEHLLSETSIKTIIDFIWQNNIHDGSHKNIAYSELGNLCHLHYPSQNSYLI
jgi:hypothetical protein